MKVLLIEDEITHCEEYKKCVDYLPYSIELSISYGYQQGVEMTLNTLPDIIILDLEFHESDGDGLLLLNYIRNLKTIKIPCIIIITHNISQNIYKTVRQHGADYIFPKSKPDYSPRLVLDFAYNYCLNQLEKTNNEDEHKLETKIKKRNGQSRYY